MGATLEVVNEQADRRRRVPLFLLTFGTQGSQVAKSQQVLLPNYVAL